MSVDDLYEDFDKPVDNFSLFRECVRELDMTMDMKFKIKETEELLEGPVSELLSFMMQLEETLYWVYPSKARGVLKRKQDESLLELISKARNLITVFRYYYNIASEEKKLHFRRQLDEDMDEVNMRDLSRKLKALRTAHDYFINISKF
jgi:hypothetical protein